MINRRSMIANVLDFTLIHPRTVAAVSSIDQSGPTDRSYKSKPLRFCVFLYLVSIRIGAQDDRF